MKVSFILPCYNTGRYLDKCIESIRSQTFPDWEMILIDDGSLDDTGERCDSWSALDKRIRTIHQSNQGISVARNRGLEEAEGDYVVFVDSDDFWCQNNDLEWLIQKADSYPQCDFIGFNCSYYYASSNSYRPWVTYLHALGEPVPPSEAMIKLVQSGTIPMSACLKLLKRSTLITNNIRFQPGITAEDIPWFIQLMKLSTSCCFFNRYVYAYRQQVAGSITNSNHSRSYNNLKHIVEEQIDLLKNDRETPPELQDALFSFMAYEYCIMMGLVHDHPNARQERAYLRSRTWLLDYRMNPKVARVAHVYRLLGYRLTELALRIYLTR